MREIQAMAPGRLYLGHGLVLIKNETSTRWVFRYTSPLTKRVTETSIGPWPEYGYSSARQVANDLLVMVAKGQDPVQEARLQEASKITFAECCEGWSKILSASLQPDAKLVLKHCASLSTIAVRKIDADMIDNALADLLKRHPLQARRMRAFLESLFDHAKAKGYRNKGDDNPADRKIFRHRWGLLPKRPKNHYPSLPYDEVPEFVRRLRLRQVKGTAALALEFVILHGSRPNEVLGMNWSEFHKDQKLWIVPAERMKNREEHRVPLSDRAMQILAVQYEFRKSDFVFTGRKNVALDEKSLRELMYSMGMKGIASPHGFRRSFRTWGRKIKKFDFDELERSLAHKVLTPVQQAYFQDDLLDERRPIMTEWANYIDGNGSITGQK